MPSNKQIIKEESFLISDWFMDYWADCQTAGVTPTAKELAQDAAEEFEDLRGDEDWLIELAEEAIDMSTQG